MLKAQCVPCLALTVVLGLSYQKLAGESHSLRSEQGRLAARLTLLDTRVEESSGITPRIEERIIDLPEDGHTWHTILFLRPDWQRLPVERKAHTIFFTETGLSSLRQQTHWHVITTDQPEFQPFRSLVTITPCLVVERANGEVIYRESGPQLGRDNDGLRRAICREVERHCPDGRCLPLHPTPGPAPEPPDEIPAALKEERRAHEERNPLATIAATLAGLAGGAALNWRKNG